jgi:hypothetical protein
MTSSPSFKSRFNNTFNSSTNGNRRWIEPTKGVSYEQVKQGGIHTGYGFTVSIAKEVP